MEIPIEPARVSKVCRGSYRNYTVGKCGAMWTAAGRSGPPEGVDLAGELWDAEVSVAVVVEDLHDLPGPKGAGSGGRCEGHACARSGESLMGGRVRLRSLLKPPCDLPQPARGPAASAPRSCPRRGSPSPPASRSRRAHLSRPCPAHRTPPPPSSGARSGACLPDR
jgi:hypothetical protein